MLDKVFDRIAENVIPSNKLEVVDNAIDPYEFIFKYAYTLDPHDLKNPVKLIPDYPYIRELIRIFLRDKLIAVVKSRQLLVTWLFCALHVWLCANYRGQYVFFISRKEADAGFDTPLSLCSRALFVYQNLPKELKPSIVKSLQPPVLKFPKNFSVIQGVSQDSDALRQYTASSVLCIAPRTKVLTHDLRWIEAGKIKKGEFLAGFEETSGQSGFKPNGEGRMRQWKKTVVEEVRKFVSPCYRLTFDNGTQIVCSKEHRWLRGYKQGWKWLTTEKLRERGTSKHYGRGWAGSKIVKLSEVWEEDKSYAAGYLAAAFDGEGSFRQKLYKRDGFSVGGDTQLGVSQNENRMLEEIKNLLGSKGFHCVSVKKPIKGRTSVHHILYIGKRTEVMRFLGQIRPKRLLEKLDLDKWGSAVAAGGVELLKKEFIGEQEVIGFKTSTGTFLAEGLASHNSDEMAFQEHANEAYAAIKPTIDGGGRLICVSTPNGKNNLFYKIVQGV